MAVYRSEMEKLAAAERSLADTLAPVEALRAWLLLFVDAVETKRIIAPVLNALVGVANVSASPDWQQSARRLVDILILGARPWK